MCAAISWQPQMGMTGNKRPSIKLSLTGILSLPTQIIQNLFIQTETHRRTTQIGTEDTGKQMRKLYINSILGKIKMQIRV